MFQFPGLPPARLCVQRAAAGYGPRRVRPFGDPRVKRICAPNRGLSQLVTSFVGFLCQGIHRVPLPSSSRWLGTYIHPGGLSVAGAIRCDLLEKEKYRLCHAMQLSRYGEGEPSRPDTARSRATKGISGNGRAPSRL